MSNLPANPTLGQESDDGLLVCGGVSPGPVRWMTKRPPKFTCAAGAPVLPLKGDEWQNSADGVIRKFDGSVWIGPGKASPFYKEQEDAPTNVPPGFEWLKLSDMKRSKLLANGQWVEV
jgi:hypothetical protein